MTAMQSTARASGTITVPMTSLKQSVTSLTPQRLSMMTALHSLMNSRQNYRNCMIPAPESTISSKAITISI